MPNQTWLVRECNAHGLISVDGGDLTSCPAPDEGNGQCGQELSPSFLVIRMSPAETFSSMELKVLDWLKHRRWEVFDPTGQIANHIDAASGWSYGRAGVAIRALRGKGVVEYQAAPGRGTTRLKLIVPPESIGF